MLMHVGRYNSVPYGLKRNLRNTHARKMASSLADRYHSLSLNDCFKDPLSRNEDSLSVDPLVDISFSASTFVLPPGKQVKRR